MCPEINSVLKNSGNEFAALNGIALQNAEKLLNYIDDINLERKTKFELTPADSLYLLWKVEDWEFHIECLKSGKISYTFRKGRFGKACGSSRLNDFIPYLEKYLLMIFAGRV